MATLKKVKLGKKASSFFDPVTRLKVTPGQVVEVSIQQQKSDKFQSALTRNWLVETEEAVSKDSEEDATKETGKFDGYTVDKLKEYINENYELEPEDQTRVSKMKKAELLEYIEELEAEDETED